MAESGADVLSLDWRVDLADAARRVGARVSLQGNLDPCALPAPPDEIARRVRALADAGRARARPRAEPRPRRAAGDARRGRARLHRRRARAGRRRVTQRRLRGRPRRAASELLPRYATDGPRYTSYPTAPCWSEAYGVGAVPRGPRATRTSTRATGSRSTCTCPFCESLCHFCACNKVITTGPRARAAAILDAIEREIDAVRDALRVAAHRDAGPLGRRHADLARRRTRSGGSVRALTEAFPLRRDAEVSIEVDPRVTTRAHLEALAECGFNRISMGVQDFDPRVQEAMHRDPDAGADRASWSRARATRASRA